MCRLCDAQEDMAQAGLLRCGWCQGPLDERCGEGHAYCACSEPMDRYDGGGVTRCFRCATGLV